MGFWLWLLAPKAKSPTKGAVFGGCFFQKQLLFRSTFLKAGLTLLLAFGFLLFEIGGIKSSFIVVSREIKIEGIFYTCLTKQLSAFLQLTAHSSFSTAHSQQQLFSTATAQPNRVFGWAFGFGFWPQKPKAQPKGLLLEGAFSEAAAFP